MNKENNLYNNEEIICNEFFSYSWLLFFIKFNLQATTRRISGFMPSVFLFVPTGKTQVTYSYRNIAGVTIHSSYKVIRMFMAVIFLIIDFRTFFKFDIASIIAFLFFYVLIAVLFLSGIKCYMSIENNAGSRINHSIAFYEKRKANEFANDVNNALADFTV